MEKNLREVQDYFNSAVNFIERKNSIVRKNQFGIYEAPKILYLGEMSLEMACEARTNGIIPLIVIASGQELINFVCNNKYSIDRIEDGKGIAYLTSKCEKNFDYVTDGKSITPVIGSIVEDENLFLLVGDKEETRKLSLEEEKDELLLKKMPMKAPVKAKVPSFLS